MLSGLMMQRKESCYAYYAFFPQRFFLDIIIFRNIEKIRFCGRSLMYEIYRILATQKRVLQLSMKKKSKIVFPEIDFILGYR